MRKFTINWGVAVAAVVLLTYTYISFLGMLYKVDGVTWKSVLFAIFVIVVVSSCIYFMVNAKMTKNKQMGRVGQVALGLIIMLVFLFSGSPFTSFLKVVSERHRIEDEVRNVKQMTAGIDSCYSAYVTERVSQYRMQVDNELRVQSLQRRLMPDTIFSVQQQRQEWVSKIEDMTIWNISLPQNLSYMQQCVTEWVNNYKQLSDFAYDGQQLNPFNYTEFDEKLEILMNDLKKPGYSIWAVLVAILATLAMLFPYWLAIPAQTKKNNEIVFK